MSTVYGAMITLGILSVVSLLALGSAMSVSYTHLRAHET